MIDSIKLRQREMFYLFVKVIFVFSFFIIETKLIYFIYQTKLFNYKYK